jgi:hypothetical protein
MTTYHKIDSVFKRDPTTKYKTFLFGNYTNEAFEYLAKSPWIWTEKVDGMNVRVVLNENGVTFGGKSDAAIMPIPLLSRLHDRFVPQLDKLKVDFPNGAVFYGEGYGGKIQKGGERYRKEQDFILFDVKIGESWLSRNAVVSIGASLGLDVVPVVGYGTLEEFMEAGRKGFQSYIGSGLSEGLVARPKVELRDSRGGRIITKVKHRDFEPVQVTEEAEAA